MQAQRPAARPRQAQAARQQPQAQQQAVRSPEETQNSQPTRSSSVMDPGQNIAERRKLRKNYRELIQKTTGKFNCACSFVDSYSTDVRQEYIRPESDGLIKVLEQGDELYQDGM